MMKLLITYFIYTYLYVIIAFRTHYINVKKSKFDNRFLLNAKINRNSQEKFKKSILEKICEAPESDTFATLLYGLAVKKTHVSNSEKIMISSEIFKRSEQFNVHHISAILWSIGTLKLINIPILANPNNNNEKSERVKSLLLKSNFSGSISHGQDISTACDILLERLDLNKRFLTASDLSLLLIGLARIGRLTNHPKYNRDSFLSSITHLISYMDNQQVSNTVWALGKIGVDWDAPFFDNKAKKAVFETIRKSLPKMRPQGISNTIHGLSNMINRREQLPDSLLKYLIRYMLSSVKFMSEQEFSNSLSGLSRLGVIYTDISHSGQKLISDRFITLSKESVIGCKGIAMTVHALGKMNTDWYFLSSGFRVSTIKTIDKTSPDCNALEVSNLLYGMAKMGIIWNEFPLHVREKLLEAFVRESWRMTPQGLSNSCWGLMLMKVNWNTDVTGSFRKSVWDAVQREIEQFNEQEIANLFYALSKMELSMSAIPLQTCYSILKQVTNQLPLMTHHGVVMTLSGMGKFKMKWVTLTESLKAAVISSVTKMLENNPNMDAFNSIAYSLSILGIDWKTLNKNSNILQNYILKSMIPTLQEDNLLNPSLKKSENIFMHESIQNSLKSPGEILDPKKIIKSKLKSSIIPSYTHESKNISFIKDNLFSSFENITTNTLTLASLLENVKIEHSSTNHQNIENSKPSSQYQYQYQTSQPVRLLVDFAQVKIYPTGSNFSMLEHAKLKAKYTNVSSSYRTNTMDFNHKTKANHLAQPFKVAGHSNTRKNDVNILIARREHISTYKSTRSKKTSSMNNQNNQHITDSTLTNDLSFQKESFSNILKFIYSLGKVSCDWNDIEPNVRDSLSEKLISALNNNHDEFNEQIIVNTFHGLSAMSIKWKQLHYELRSSLLRNMMLISESLTEQGISVLILALAKLEVCWQKDLNEDMKNVLRRAITRQSFLSEHALSSLLYGLGKLGRQWNDLHPHVKSSLKEAIVVCHISEKCTPLGVVNSLYGLALMNAEWSSLSSSVRMALIDEITIVLPHMTDNQLTTMLWSISKLSVTWNDLPHKTQSAILLQTDRVLSGSSNFDIDHRKVVNMNSHHIGSLIYSIGKLGVTKKALPSHMQESIINSLLRIGIQTDAEMMMTSSSPHSSSSDNTIHPNAYAHAHSQHDFSLNEKLSQDLSMSLMGLSRMGFSWNQLPNKTINKLKDLLLKLIEEMNHKQLSTTIFSLGNLGVSWESLGLKIRKSFVNSLIRSVYNFSPSEFSYLMNGLGSMGTLWINLPSHLTDKLQNKLYNVSQIIEPEIFSSALYGLALMECQWEINLKSKVRHGIINAIVNISSTKYLVPQTLSNLMYSLSLLVFDVNLANDPLQRQLSKAHSALLNALKNINNRKFNEKERDQVLMYLYLLNQISPTVKVKPLYFESNKNYLNIGSKLQESVVSSLSNALYTRNDELCVTNEYSAFGGILPVDATIFNHEDTKFPIAFLEVDGPHHFINGKLRRKDVMKEMMYRNKYPLASFTRVSYDQVKILGAHRIAAAVANFITLTSRNTESEKKMAKHEVAHAFSSRSAARNLKKVLSVKNTSDTDLLLKKQPLFHLLISF